MNQIRQLERQIEDLGDELKRLQAEAKQRRQESLRKCMTQDVIDALAPEHGRTNCDDELLQNSHGRCERCTLMYCLATDNWSGVEEISVSLRIAR